MKSLSLGDIARKIDGDLAGDETAVIRGVAGLREAQSADISFLANPKYAPYMATTAAAAVLVDTAYDGPVPTAVIRVDNPDAAFAQVAMWFAEPAPEFAPGIHPTAVIASDARIGMDVYVGPYCVIESGAVIGDRSILVAQCYVGHNARIGSENRFHPQVTVREEVRMGNRVVIHSHAVIGSDGFGYSVNKEGVRSKIPQIGIVEIGDDVEIGAGTTIDRARFGRTIIGKGVKIDNLVQIAHNVVIGDHAVLVAQVGISGSTVIGQRAILAGQSGVAGHLVLGDGVIAEGRSGVTKDIPPGQIVYGYPAAPRERAARIHAHVQRLPRLKERVKELETRIQQLEARLGGEA